MLGRAQGTVEWRMRRLRAAGLVACTRPPRLSGTAPLHFWLTASGHRLIGSTGPARDPDTPNVLFLAHTTAVAGLALALADAPGLALASWRREQEAWEWWRITESGLFGGPRAGDEWKLRPDALAVLDLEAGGRSHAFVEVDRGTMSHGRLRAKLTGYLRYAADRGWDGRHPSCPPLLFLTCSDERAGRVLAGASELRQGREAGRGWMAGGRARELVVAACGLADDPDAAAAAEAWRTDDGRGPAALAPLLAACAQSATAARAAERAAADEADAAAVAREREAAWVAVNLGRGEVGDRLLAARSTAAPTRARSTCASTAAWGTSASRAAAAPTSMASRSRRRCGKAVRGLLADPERLLSMVREYLERRGAQMTAERDQLAAIDSKIAAHERAVKRTLVDYALQWLPAHAVRAATDELQRELGALRRHLAQVRQWQVANLSDSERMRKLWEVADLAHTRLATMIAEERVRVLALLHVRVTVIGADACPDCGGTGKLPGRRGGYRCERCRGLARIARCRVEGTSSTDSPMPSPRPVTGRQEWSGISGTPVATTHAALSANRKAGLVPRRGAG